MAARLAFILLACVCFLPGAVRGAPAAEILYGTVTTADGHSHTGFLRPDGDDTFRDDVFRGTRSGPIWNDHLDLESLAKQRRDEYFAEHGLFKRLEWVLSGKNKEHENRVRLFLCRYGDLERLDLDEDEDEVLFTVRDGSTHAVQWGRALAGDLEILGADTVTVDWEDVRAVAWHEPPTGAVPPAIRLAGTVTTDTGSWTGAIQWDLSECTTVHILDGEDPDGQDHEVPMGELAAIARGDRDDSILTFTDGRTLRLDGTNDVNHDNRGIAVETATAGRITVPWKHFARVDFHGVDTAGAPWVPAIGPLQGQVTATGGAVHEGRIVWDLDEGWNWDIFNGEHEGTEYDIPFALIAEVERQGDDVRLRLRDGTVLPVSGGQDGGPDNEGLLVLGDQGTVLLAWSDVALVRFR